MKAIQKGLSTFGLRLLELREMLGGHGELLSYPQLARKVTQSARKLRKGYSVDRETLRRWSKGHGRPDLDACEVLSEIDPKKRSPCYWAFGDE